LWPASATLLILCGVPSDNCLCQQLTLSKCEQPAKHNLEFFQDWYRRPEMGHQPLSSEIQHVWRDPHERDLLAIIRPLSTDPVSRWIAAKAIPISHTVFGKHFKVSKTSLFEFVLGL